MNMGRGARSPINHRIRGRVSRRGDRERFLQCTRPTDFRFCRRLAREQGSGGSRRRRRLAAATALGLLDLAMMVREVPAVGEEDRRTRRIPPRSIATTCSAGEAVGRPTPTREEDEEEEEDADASDDDDDEAALMGGPDAPPPPTST